ncbi:biotin carboxylase [Kitasatospora sp. NBC_01287]|uniref:ATP-grasp domain-containing protein n=1 Tax=Kitasatospora sp. NBC_01287 TaxID=2903573 RepID=UPI002253B164|nr:biotin carboxylase [Kitasatospora sp. NBC_01287]MCX4744052.1 biotin carboxylase [Kitasatospora sp. NBC_01287]
MTGAGPGGSTVDDEQGAHIVVLHRWRDRHARYAEYLDHRALRVSYVTTELARGSVPPEAAAVLVVSATDAQAEVRGAVAELTGRLGPVRRLVALNEGDLDTAAALRTELGLPGQQTADLARFRDKLVMVAAADRAGVRVPAYADAPDAAAVLAFAERHGWPVVLKPRRGTASRGVVVLDGAGELARLQGALGAEPHLVQSFVPAPVFHLDGLWTGERLGPWRASRYVNSCREFTEGAFLGSVEVDDAELLAPIERFTTEVAAALGDGEPWVFHLEVFVNAGPDGAPLLTFLEAGARVGGAEIPFVWREVHGFDLMAAAVDIQLDRTPAAPALPPTRTAGWLLLPLPVAPPCRVLEARCAAGATGGATGGATAGDGPYARVVPVPGTVIPKVGGYEHVAARFRFQGATGREVEAAIVETATSFRVRCEALPG